MALSRRSQIIYEFDDGKYDRNGTQTFDGMFDRQKAPLKGRRNIVVTSQAAEYRSRFAADYSTAELNFTTDINCGDIELATDSKIFYCGGANIYQQVIQGRDIEIIYLSRLDEGYDCDTFFPSSPQAVAGEFVPDIPSYFTRSFADRMTGTKSFTFEIYTPKPLILY